jgi:hypothetical protein
MRLALWGCLAAAMTMAVPAAQAQGYYYGGTDYSAKNYSPRRENERRWQESERERQRMQLEKQRQQHELNRSMGSSGFDNPYKRRY